MAFITPFIFNISTGQLVLSVAQPTPVANPAWFYLDTKHLAIQFVQNGATNGTVTVVPAAGIGLVIGAGTPGSTPLTSATAPAADATNTFTVDLPMGTAGILSALGSGAAVPFTTVFELRTSDGVNFQRYELPLKIMPSLLSGTITATPPPDVAIGVNAANATFAKKVQLAGDFEIWKSDDGSRTARVYLGRDGVIHADPLV